MSSPALAERPFRRILVALDASRASLAALEEAAALAARHGAELNGLFVEDVDLLRTAALAFAGQVTLLGGVPVPSASIVPGLKALAERAEAALAAAAASRQLRWSFRVARGRVVREVLHAASSADLLVLGRAGRGLGGHSGRSGSTAATAAAQAHPPVLVTSLDAGAVSRLAVAWDGSTGAAGALDLALRLSAFGEGTPALLVAARAREEAAALAVAAAARAGRRLPWAWVGGANPGDLRRALPRDAVLVLGTGSPVAGGEAGLVRLLDEAHCPVLLTR